MIDLVVFFSFVVYAAISDAQAVGCRGPGTRGLCRIIASRYKCARLSKAQHQSRCMDRVLLALLLLDVRDPHAPSFSSNRHMLSSFFFRLPINKLTVIYLPFANTCLFIQALCTVGILLAGKHFSYVSFPSFSAQKAKLWVGVMFAWLLPMIVSMIALKYLTVETVVVFRTLSTFGVALGDRYFFGKQFSQPALVSMIVTVSGGILYAISDAHFSGIGYFWGLMYFLATIYNGLYIKLIFTQSVDMSNWEKTYYNNLMALPVTLLLILFSESVPGIFSSMLGMSVGGWLVILLSGVMGTAISVAGTNTRDLLSATSFNIAGNVNKFLSVGFSVLFLYAPPIIFLGLFPSSLNNICRSGYITPVSAAGLVVSLCGGAAYAYFTM
jgi:hypothetical protein